MTIVFILSYAAVFMFAVCSTKLGLYDPLLERLVEGTRETLVPMTYPKPIGIDCPNDPVKKTSS